MNQILNVELPQKKEQSKKKNYNNYNKQPKDIKSITKFFAIVILIFAIVLIGVAGYSIYNNYLESISNTKPSISVNQINENTIDIKIEHDKAISKVTYSWNYENETEIETNDKKGIEQQISIKEGQNTLTIRAVDINGQESVFEQSYTLVGSISIDFQAEGNSVKVLLDSDKTISRMTYRWDEETEVEIQINDKQAEQEIQVPPGEHTLKVIAIDEDNTTSTKEQVIKGVEEPVIETEIDETGKFVITLKDEFGLEKVELVANETDTMSRDLEGVKETKFGYQLQDGENIIQVSVTNIEGINVVKEFKPVK